MIKACNDMTCSQCGGDLEFNIKSQNIRCPYCGYEEEIIKSFGKDTKERSIIFQMKLIILTLKLMVFLKVLKVMEKWLIYC